MIRRGIWIAVATLAALLAAPLAAQAAPVKAGVAALDASWHVGSSAGQYASDGTFVGVHGVDPTTHSTRRAPSYGIQSRLQVRAIVIQGTDGRRVAIVKNDLYIPQDLLYRRTAQLLEQGNSGITRETLTMAVSHNHSSPYYSATSWGVWTFQDVFDIRFFDYYAKRMAAAVEQAAARLVPVRVGASVSRFDKTHRHSFGPAIADDGTPAGYPHGDTDHDMTVIRFDDISNPRRPRPLANIVNYSLHPEFLSGNDLISADYLGPLERMVDRRTRALTIFTQNAVGTSEPERSTYHSMHERLEFTHREYAQAEYGARLMADSAIDTWNDIGRRTPADRERFVPFRSEFPVAMEDRWFPGPISHPYPGVSNCRVDRGFHGEPQVPVVGLPTCQSPQSGIRELADIAGYDEPPEPPRSPIDPGVSTDDLQRLGIPIPENYSVPSYTGLEEDVSVHLQAIKLGDILLTVCSCEQWYDQSHNMETRTNARQGDQYLGYDWSKRCRPGSGGTWTCPDPRRPETNLPPIPDQSFQRMRAQVLNDASGWDSLEYAPYAESEPVDTTLIKGNYTHEELPRELSYRLTVPISMANDYNGYLATYREYQRGDHYRKSLTAWGPHSSDYMATRLVRMGGHMNGGPDLPPEPGQEKVEPDLALNDQRAAALGEVGDTSIRAYEAALPDDGGPVVALEQPKDVERFAAAFFSWNGGSNFTDNPDVRVERRDGSRWVPFADRSGEVPITLAFPQGPDVPSYLTGGHRWKWTAHFEAFASQITNLGERPAATPAGTYRFVVDGLHRQGGQARPYRIVSEEFEVAPWRGITVEDLRLDRDGTVSYRVGPRHTFKAEERGRPTLTAEIGPIDYPDSYKSPARFIRERRTAIRDPAAPTDPNRLEWYCFTCSFRPWIDAANAKTGVVTVVRRDGSTRRVRAVERRGRWVARRAVCPGQSAYVAAGGVRDFFGNLNGAASGRVSGRVRNCARRAGRPRGRGVRPRPRGRGRPRFTG